MPTQLDIEYDLPTNTVFVRMNITDAVGNRKGGEYWTKPITVPTFTVIKEEDIGYQNFGDNHKPSRLIINNYRTYADKKREIAALIAMFFETYQFDLGVPATPTSFSRFIEAKLPAI